MILFIIAYLSGCLTIVSPCILPVLPFVFARAGQPFWRGTLPMLIGLAVTFAGVATLAAIGGGWAVQANEYGRDLAMAVLAVFGVVLLFPSLSDRITSPFVSFGAKLSKDANHRNQSGASTVISSALLGVATGFLWAPCAGPVLGLILTVAALRGANIGTSLLLLAYALGAATSLALALLVGGRVYQFMKRSLGIGEWVRRVIGIAVLAAVVVVASGLDTSVLRQVSLASTTSLEQGLISRLFHREVQSAGVSTARQGGAMTAGTMPTEKELAAAGVALPVEGPMPSLDGAVQWLNSPPLTTAELKGKVVLVDFWTYSCVNCLRSLPYVRAWAAKYKDQGLVVIGVHTPEFAFEKNIENVKKAVADLKIAYPVAIDNNYAIWRAFNNEYWPAHYFIDAQGRIRDHHFGEGDYDGSERIIQELLAEAGLLHVASAAVDVHASGAEAASNPLDVQSPETYIGWQRAENFVNALGPVKDSAHVYTMTTPLLNHWGLTGNWTVGPEYATLNDKDGTIYYRFHARDLHLVLGPGADGKPVRFQVTVDGKSPGDNHGTDTDADGKGVVTEQGLYQLVREKGAIEDHTFEIRFLDPGLQAYAFTFG
jgi:cytochrome c biogenesis protein CcdA/thiol-disulfide isomerase/thioredoxin